jgi:hypothetical protein
LTPQDLAEGWKMSKMNRVESALYQLPIPAISHAWQVASDSGDEKDMATAKKVLTAKLSGGAWARLKPEDRTQLAPILRMMLTPKTREKEAEAAGA